MTTLASPIPTVIPRRRTAATRTGAYKARVLRMSQGSLSTVSPLSSRLASAGTVVKDRTSAPSTAAQKVAAIGMNIFPSIPTRAKIGRNTTTMISSPKPAAVRISTAAS